MMEGTIRRLKRRALRVTDISMVSQEDIIREATVLFAEKGFKATSIVEISKAVNLSASAGGIYRHFRSKRAIFDAIFDSYFENFDTFLNDVDINVNKSSNVQKKALAQGLINMSLQQAKSNKHTIKLYFRELDRINDKHRAQSKTLRENSIKAFLFVCQYVGGEEGGYDGEAIAAILIDSINFRVCEFSPDFGISEDRFITALTELLYALVVGD